MASSSATIPVEPAVYSRRARQIRARFARQPGAMHTALRGLAERADRKPWREPATQQFLRPGRRVDAVVAGGARNWLMATALERGFAGHVADRLASGPFTFSDRMKLLRSAERIGIARFEANLIISLARNPAGCVTSTQEPAKPPVLPGRNCWKSLLIAAATQAVIAGLLYLGLR